MSSDLIRQEDDGAVLLVEHATGELVPLGSASPQLIATTLGRVQERIDEALAHLRAVKGVLGEAMIERMDADGAWTVTAPGVKVVAPSPAAQATTWDAEALHAALEALEDEGVITRDARLRAVEVRHEYRVVVRGVNALLKNPKAAPRIEACRREVEPPRRSVRVTTTAGSL